MEMDVARVIISYLSAGVFLGDEMIRSIIFEILSDYYHYLRKRLSKREAEKRKTDGLMDGCGLFYFFPEKDIFLLN